MSIRHIIGHLLSFASFLLLLKNLVLKLNLFQRRRRCPWLCSLPSLSTLELLQLSTFEFKLCLMFDVCRSFREKTCLYNQKDKLKKIKLKMLFFLFVFSCPSSSMPTLVTESLTDWLTDGCDITSSFLQLWHNLFHYRSYLHTGPTWPTYLTYLTCLTYLPDLPTYDLPTWPTWLDSQLWHNLFQSVQCRTQLFTNVVFVKYLL